MNAWIGRAVLAVAGLGMAALALEIGLRVLYPDVPIIRRDERLGSLARPNLDVRKTFGGHERVVRVTTNASGLRGAEVPTGKLPGQRRVLALGDSFTFGDAVEAEETWPAQLEARLNRGGSTSRWQVVNAGIPGHGTGQQLLLARMLEERVRPDVVVLGFTVVNDVLDNLCVEEASYTPKRGVPCFVLDGQRLQLVAPARIEPAPARPARSRAVDFLAGEARRVALGHPRLLALAGWSGVATDLPYVPATVASWYDARYAEPGWRLTQRLLMELREQLRAERVPLVILVIPAALQVDAGLQSALRALGARHAAVGDFLADPARPQRLVGDFCRSAALDCLDVRPALLELAERGTRTYYPIDNHWTPAAHDSAADLVARHLADRALADVRGRERAAAR
ncbi:MAG TPA: GDSL-type esterase/lipase family protein [Candidatus Acidoferrum sp.]|nr:GDSL-type esterase/lipase family protein [Candidatus Acidoferrum sp.]